MAKLVQITAVTHNPSLVRGLARPTLSPAAERGKQKWVEMRERLARAKPDVLLVIANDHLNQWFMDNMPAFLVGKAPRAKAMFKTRDVAAGCVSSRLAEFVRACRNGAKHA